MPVSEGLDLGFKGLGFRVLRSLLGVLGQKLSLKRS